MKITVTEIKGGAIVRIYSGNSVREIKITGRKAQVNAEVAALKAQFVAA